MAYDIPLSEATETLS